MIAPNETAPNFKQIMKYSQPSVICTAIEQCGTCNYGSSIMIMLIFPTWSSCRPSGHLPSIFHLFVFISTQTSVLYSI